VAPPRPRTARLLDVVGRVREVGIAFALGLVVLIVGIQEPRFLEPDNLEEILLPVAILAVVATGQTLVVLTRNIDLSVGSVVGFTAFVCADTIKASPGTPVIVILLFGLGMGAGFGVVDGLMVTVGRVPAIVVTLGTLYIFRGLDFIIAEGKQVNAADVPEAYLNLATGHVLGIPALILFASPSSSPATACAAGGPAASSTPSAPTPRPRDSPASRRAGSCSSRSCSAAHSPAWRACSGGRASARSTPGRAPASSSPWWPPSSWAA
jgi:Branched-chain amino acid transport system / permease component